MKWLLLVLSLFIVSPAWAQTQTVTLTLQWQDMSNAADASEDAFEIERCQGAGCSNFVKVGQVGQNVVNYKDVITADTGGVTYCYRVRAVNKAGASAYSNTACGTSSVIIIVPPAPSNLTIPSITVSSVDLQWQNGSTAIAKNELEGRRAGQAYTRFATLAGASEYARVEGLRRNSTYTFRMRACGDVICSEYATWPQVKTGR